MPRPPLIELERLCQKPDHRRVGNWMARRIARPMALRVTWVIEPWGLSATAMTLLAWSAGIAAAIALAWGNPAGWIGGAALLQLWYLLDHVDGQLARLRRRASLDGTQLDYLMHHTISLLIPLGLGCGLYTASLEPLWFLAGLAWGLGLLVIGLSHDARYKAFIQRLKRLRGELRAIGGGGARPKPPASAPRRLLPLAAWLARKSCELHVTMNVLTLLAIIALISPALGLIAMHIWAAAMALVALTVAIVSLVRSQRRQAAEEEFGRWYQVPPQCELEFEEGWWFVRSSQTTPRLSFNQEPTATAHLADGTIQ
jgi:phosphatidylglycerophosphate synthase